MFACLFKKKKPEKCSEINHLYKKIKEVYSYNSISEERKEYLTDLIGRYGYLPYSYIKALEELTPAEIIFGLEFKWNNNNIFSKDGFSFNNNEISPVVRAGYTNSDWMKQEQHEIKLVNLAALGDGNKSHEVGKFIDWLRQLLILPAGNSTKNVLSTTIYMIPFHPREFGCAYLPTSSDVSPILEDKFVKESLGLNGKEQIQLFINLAQLAGHPVIYDVLPQTGRYSKQVLSNPSIARWFDVKQLIKEINEAVDDIAIKLNDEFDPEDIDIVKTIYKNTMQSGSDDLSEFYKNIYNKFSEELLEYKKIISNKMLNKQEQIKLQNRAKDIIAKAHITKPQNINKESDIINQGQAIQDLIKEGLWPAPGGAWCSAGVPIFDKMSECGGYPVFKHFDREDNDVTHFANLDCQTPYYFVFLETGEYNNKVIEYYIDSLKTLQKDYNFDGIRVDHIDHVVDEVSQSNDRPISYRAPKIVLEKSNKALKQQCKHFAILAEYMLGGHYYKEYHEDMNFDILWGNDIISQYEKNPYEIVKNNQDLQAYNSENPEIPNLSIIKTYNNQDGEFRAIDQYPGQLGEDGALFKWLKLRFLPGGKNAKRPLMYVDGDESFTKTGIESTIGSEISLAREHNEKFYKKFDAISRFARENELTLGGEAQIITQDDSGFVCWMISKDPLKETLLIIANYLAPTEKISIQQNDGTMDSTIKEGEAIFSKSIEIPGDYKVISEIVYDEKQFEFVEKTPDIEGNTLYFEQLEPSEFKIFKLLK